MNAHLSKPVEEQILKHLAVTPHRDLRNVLTKLVESGAVSAEQVKETLTLVRTEYNGRLKTALGGEKLLAPLEKWKLLRTLKKRFTKYRKLHEDIRWQEVARSLEVAPEKLWSLQWLEMTGGQPSVIGEDPGRFIFCDCSEEIPSGRRDMVFDREAEQYIKRIYREERFNGNAVDIAAEHGADLMDEDQYRALHAKLRIDRDSWNWLKTPDDIRRAGKAFCGGYLDGRIVVYPANADYHGRRGFRAVLWVEKAEP